MLHPNVHLGSVYLWYDQIAQRERPGGYSTIAPQSAARLSLRLAELNCGDWRPGDDALLRRLGVRYVAFHRGLAGETGWFAWRELLDHGFGQVARDDGVHDARARPGRRVVARSGAEQARRLLRGLERRLAALPPRRLLGSRAGASSAVEPPSPCAVTISVDRRPVATRRVGAHEPSLLLRGKGWQLIGVDVTRADRGLHVSASAR